MPAARGVDASGAVVSGEPVERRKAGGEEGADQLCTLLWGDTRDAHPGAFELLRPPRLRLWLRLQLRLRFSTPNFASPH